MPNPLRVNIFMRWGSGTFFGTKPEALVDMIRGKFNPKGKQPFTLPASEEAIVKGAGDVPGF